MSRAAAATSPKIGARLVRATTYAPPPLGYARQTCRYDSATTVSRSGDRDRDLDRQEHRRGAADDQDAQDLLGRVGRRRDRVRTEDGERLLLVEALVDVGLARQRSSEDGRSDSGEGSPGPRSRDGRGLASDEATGPFVAEERRVRPFDPDAAIAGLSPGQRASTADHRPAPARPDRQQHRGAGSVDAERQVSCLGPRKRGRGDTFRRAQADEPHPSRHPDARRA